MPSRVGKPRAAVPARAFNQQSAIAVVPASRLEIRPAPEMASTGIPALDTLTGGLPRGCLTEICGSASSGRTSVLLSSLAAATRRGEYCALIDAGDALDPHFAEAAGVDLDRLLWVRCGEHVKPRSAGGSQAMVGASRPRPSENSLEQLLRATDLLLESGGFGLIVLDLADMPPQVARRIPLTTWFRFRRAVEHKPTILLVIEQQPIAGSCSSLLLRFSAAERRQNAAYGASRGSGGNDDKAPKERKKKCVNDSGPTHSQLFSGLGIDAEIVCSRLNRKPARSITFETRTAWAG